MRPIRSIAVAAIGVALVACGGPVPIGGEPAPVPEGPVRFENVVLAEDRHSVRVNFIGGREFKPDDPCSLAYEGTADVVGEELVIGIYAIQHPAPLAPNQGCDAMGHARTLTLPLKEPFEGTVVRDLAGQTLLLGPSPPPPSASAERSVNAVQVETCEHASGVYRLELPDGWWTNRAFEDEELGAISACRFFAPNEFDVTSGDRDRPIPDGAAIWIDYFDGGCVGFINPTLSSRSTMIDAYPAVVTELAEGKLDTNPAFTYQYVISLGADVACEEGGRSIYALTRRDFPGDYEANKHMLDQVMESLEIRQP